MPLANGTKLGPYAILGPIGAGGMGEVYKAKDTRLDRTVAIKVLPSELAANDDLRARFEREARAVSALNHPHICTLYDIGRDNGVDFLVLEYIPGETIADRLRRGPLPLEEALRYGTQIADALDKAHRTGIAHRDLKPGNIILSESGAKLLDFGLATRLPAPESPISSLPTRAGSLTPKGAVLGTFQYMAPEQLEGKEADARTDIFAFGAVLYEMVTGQKALRTALPETEGPSTIPPLLDHLLRRCLARDPQKRWQAASDVMLELEFVAGGGGATVAAPRHPRREAVAWSIAALAVAASVTTLLLTENPTPSPVRRSTLQLSQGEGLVTGPGYFGALSPDGTHLAYRAVRNGVAQLWLRQLDRFESTPIAGSEGAGPPCFSPDGPGSASTREARSTRCPLPGALPFPSGERLGGRAPVGPGRTRSSSAIATRVSGASPFSGARRSR